MDDLINITLPQFSSTLFIAFFFKAFGVLFAFMYLIYAIVIVRQTQVMNRTFKTEYGTLLLIISFIQIVFALILIYLSLAFL